MKLPEGWHEDEEGWEGKPCWRIGEPDNVHAGIFAADRTWRVWNNWDPLEEQTYMSLKTAMEKATAAYVKHSLTQGATDK